MHILHHTCCCHSMTQRCSTKMQSQIIMVRINLTQNTHKNTTNEPLSLLQMTDATDLVNFVNLNLAIVYLRTNHQSELMELVNSIDPEVMPTGCVEICITYYLAKAVFIRLIITIILQSILFRNIVFYIAKCPRPYKLLLIIHPCNHGLSRDTIH